MDNISTFADVVQKLAIYDNSLSNLSYDPLQPRSAVAIIIKKRTLSTKTTISMPDCISISDQMLFLQRLKSANDRFSGEICFPGGKQQPNQTLLSTVIRQTFQQTHIQLKQEHLIGCIDRRVSVILPAKKGSKKSNKSTAAVYAFVFILNEEQIALQSIQLNREQMANYKWVRASVLMDVRNVCWFDYSERIKGFMRFFNYEVGENKKSNEKSPLDFVERTLSAALDVGMGQKLFGLTLYILLILLRSVLDRFQIIQKQINSLDYKDPVNTKQLNSLIHQLAQIIQRCQTHIIFQTNQPIDENFIIFQKAIRSKMQTLRPRL